MVNKSTPKSDDDIAQHLERLRADFATLSETVARVVSETAAGAQSQVHETVNKAARNASDAGGKVYQDAATLGQDAIKTAHAAAGQLEMQIARNPVTAVLAALGVGFFIGLMSNRRQ